MPRTAITFGWDAKGKASVLIGPEVAIGDQVKAMAGYKAGDMPKGILRIDRWESDGGIVSTAFSKEMHQREHAAKLKREEDEAAHLKQHLAKLAVEASNQPSAGPNAKKAKAPKAPAVKRDEATPEKPGKARAAGKGAKAANVEPKAEDVVVAPADEPAVVEEA